MLITVKKNKKKKPCLNIIKKNIKNFEIKPKNGGKPANEKSNNSKVTEKNWRPVNFFNSLSVKKFFISKTNKIENNKNSKYIYINMFK